MDYALKIVISLLPVVLFFLFYFRNFIFEQDIYHLSQAFFYGMLVSGVALIVQLVLPTTNSHLLRAFFHAAFVEEILRYGVIAVMVRRSDETFTVTEGIFRSVLVGLGFAFSENMHYALNYEGFVILLRTVSSVPMHVFTAGMMGYFLGYALHCDIPEVDDSVARARRRRLYVAALAFPVLYHTAFDYILFTGGTAQRMLPLLLAAGFLWVEHHNARARIVVPRNVLSVLGVDADDMDIITRQRYYETWLKDRQEQSLPRPRLFTGQFVRFNLILGAALILLAIAGASVLGVKPALLLRDNSLNLEVLVALVVALPGTAGLVLLAAGRLNYLFFRENLLRLPRVAMVRLRAGTVQMNTAALDVLPAGVFLADTHEVERGAEVTLDFTGRSGRLSSTGGLVRWTNAEEGSLPRGCVVRYSGRSLGFLLFVLLHQLRRIRMGVQLMVAGLVHRPHAVVRSAHAKDSGAVSAVGEFQLRVASDLATALGPDVKALERTLAAGTAWSDGLSVSVDAGAPAGEATLLRHSTALWTVVLPADSFLAVEIPGFGNPRDAGVAATELALSGAYLISTDDASAVEGIGCEVIRKPSSIIQRLIELTPDPS